ncbi:MAG: UDP-glucose 4-epimerase [Chthoniobacter sp.]|jgi:UDP-glucose 4-epimerase|nr:UDP-glucose 4-epimerase [Chthoniobacter sp.]
MKLSRTVLITGAAGFLGRHCVRQFAQEGWRVIGLDDVPPESALLGDGVMFHRMKLPDPHLAELLLAEVPSACVHSAGRASVGLSLTDPAADFRDNTVLTFEILEALRRNAPRCRFLFLSSAAVYGNPVSLPVSETHPPAPLSPYGYHKLQCELLCEEFARLFALPALSVRVFSAYGPGLRRQVVWDICERALTTGTLALHGTGRESRDFIHATDIARALVSLATTAPCEGEIYNVASGEEMTIAALAGVVLAALGVNVEPVFDGAATPGNPLNWRADVSKLHALGFVPSISLKQGLQGVADWSRAELARS